MRRKPRERDEDIIQTPNIKDNQTWNDCPECKKTWQTKPAIPGLIHRTRLCERCLRKNSKRVM